MKYKNMTWEMFLNAMESGGFADYYSIDAMYALWDLYKQSEDVFSGEDIMGTWTEFDIPMLAEFFGVTQEELLLEGTVYDDLNELMIQGKLLDFSYDAWLIKEGQKCQ